MYQAGESLTGYSGYLEVISCGDQRCMLMADRLEAITKLEVVTPHFNTPFSCSAFLSRSLSNKLALHCPSIVNHVRIKQVLQNVICCELQLSPL